MLGTREVGANPTLNWRTIFCRTYPLDYTPRSSSSAFGVLQVGGVDALGETAVGLRWKCAQASFRFQLSPAVVARQRSAADSTFVPLKKSGLFAVQNMIALSNKKVRSDFSSITPCSTSS